MTGPEIRVLPSAEAAASAAADLLVEHARGGHDVAVAGGSTPRRAYELAAERLADWTGARLWFGDDRAVPPDDERSNFRMLRLALLDRLPDDGRPAVERIRGEDGFEAAAGDYETRLRARLGNAPRLDLVVLGIGPDAHCASLFPGRPELHETARFAVGVPVAGMEPQVPRVTMTLPILNAAAEVAFLISGADKAPAVARAFGRPPDPSAPSALVRPSSGRLLVLCDEAAASRL